MHWTRVEITGGVEKLQDEFWAVYIASVSAGRKPNVVVKATFEPGTDTGKVYFSPGAAELFAARIEALGGVRGINPPADANVLIQVSW